jgi:hypothetical protein
MLTRSFGLSIVRSKRPAAQDQATARAAMCLRLDMSASTLAKTLTGGRHGTTYPDMTWETKASFRAVADCYGAAR